MFLKFKINFSTKVYKKTQKGKLPFNKISGSFLINGIFGISFIKSWRLTLSQLKAIKATILYHLPKNLKKNLNLTILKPLTKRQGIRMGRGKGKVLSYYYMISNNYLLYIIKNSLLSSNYSKNLNNIYKIKNFNLYLKFLTKKLNKKYPFLNIKHKSY